MTSVAGQQAQGVFHQASRPFENIHFANQDSVGIGNIESAVLAGLNAAKAVRERLAMPVTPAEVMS